MGLRVIAIDTGDEKKKMCLEQLGAEAFVDFAASKNVVKDVQAQTEDGLGPHAVILVAVNERPFQQAAEVWLAILFPSIFLSPIPFTPPFPLFFLRLFDNPAPLSSLAPSHFHFLSHPRSTHQLTPPQYVRPRGSVICIGLPAGAYLKAPVFETVIKMIAIKGSYVGNRRDSAEEIGRAHV